MKAETGSEGAELEVVLVIRKNFVAEFEYTGVWLLRRYRIQQVRLEKPGGGEFVVKAAELLVEVVQYRFDLDLGLT